MSPLAQAGDVSAVPPLAPAGDNGYASAALGNGILYGTSLDGQKPMRWRAAEIRFGPGVDLFGLGAGGHLPADSSTRLDYVYYNEGHPDNNHRDGYALQMAYRQKLHPGFDLELAAGPYFSMNRTTVNGTEKDDARLGGLLSVALLARLDQYSPGLSIRLAYNHVLIPGAPSSDALLLGVGKELGATHVSAADAGSNHGLWLAALGGFAQTNQSGPGKRLIYALEAKKYYGPWAASVAAIEEGDDGVRVNRHGIAAQGWYVQPIAEHWNISAGAGPYLAANQRESGDWKVNGLISLQLGRDFGNNVRGFASFGRAVTFRNKNDADLMTIGVMQRFDL
ncbi:hypothetical protein [Collimonas silvisoli]|uniref:hypothetical protein n=1 Tax=Collimonas silvisoli TaxID=2825884 RepID=UPI001B8CC818|nr:hypothetical protein [Collimonas silvisoli]